MTLTIQVTPTNVGYMTNIASAIANQPDPNSNNVQTSVTLVNPPSADVGVTLSSTPNPVLDGANETYSIGVYNNGPSIATNVLAVDTLPVGFRANTGLTTMSQGTSTARQHGRWALGMQAVASGAAASMTLVAGVDLPESSLPSSSSLDSVTVSSPAYDPVKLNNFASVKTEVEPALITLTTSGKTHSLTWPVMPGNLVLQGSINLPPTWVSITNSSVVPQLIGGQLYNTYALPGTNGYHFFRLISQLP